MENEILNILRKKKNTSLTIMEINDFLGLKTVSEYQELDKELNKLCAAGKIYYSEKKKRYTPIENTSFKVGKLMVNPKGYGFVILDDIFDSEDIFVRGNNLLDARNNDIVLLEVISKTNNEGKIIRVLQRDDSSLVGEFTVIDGVNYVVPDKKEYGMIIIPENMTKGAIQGHKVMVKRNSTNPLYGEVIRIIGHKNDVGVDILSFVYQYDFDPTYSEDVLKAVEDIPTEVKESECENRIDLRKENIFTIDGIDTKDIDDAISIKKNSDGTYVLGVHIADVSHYVKKGSILDDNAFNRGTSVYLVDRVIPMIPHKLSNGICSLNPNVDRLTLSCVMNINTKGYVTDYKIFKSVINSKKQMNYDDVNSILEDNIVPSGYEKFVSDLKLMNELSDILRRKMVNHGYLEFNSPEPKIIVDETGKPVEIKLREQRTGEKLIENFMIVANETVAGFVEDKKLPGIYRVHDTPNKEKLGSLIKFLNMKGISVKGDINKFKPTDYQRLLKMFKGRDDEIILNNMTIQTMSKAKYSDDNIGHYGIASKRYAHFTSPIRRYPDLTLHRLVKEYLFTDKTANYWKKRLFDIAFHSSKKEQDAIDCERDVEKMKKTEYMEEHVGESFDGIISGLSDFGLFVMLQNTVEGLVRFTDIPYENLYYNRENNVVLSRNSRTRYLMGDKIRVKVIKANRDTSQVDFILDN